MDLSIFSVLGPVMIGPSSSHTAGAAKLARMAQLLIGEQFRAVTFYLHGSFAKTYQGHKTNYALVAGILGIREDDEAIKESFYLANQQGIDIDFKETDLGNVHENSVKMEFHMNSGETKTITGSSLGGGIIKIFNINGFATDISFSAPTIVIYQNDKKGVIRDISEILAIHGLNIATMKVTRSTRGGTAFCIIETDETIPDDVDRELLGIENIIRAKTIQ